MPHPDNLHRMIQLAEEFFKVKDDPDQLAIDERVMNLLYAIHPSSLSETASEDGPVAWTIVVPTTRALMDAFLMRSINERQLVESTPPGDVYQALYLCSALVLPEYRRQGIARRMLCNSITEIRKHHPIEALFTWAFSEEGGQLARALADTFDLPLYALTEERHQ